MSSLFVHLEDRTSDFPEGVLITEGDEGESVAAAITRNPARHFHVSCPA